MVVHVISAYHVHAQQGALFLALGQTNNYLHIALPLTIRLRRFKASRLQRVRVCKGGPGVAGYIAAQSGSCDI